MPRPLQPGDNGPKFSENCHYPVTTVLSSYSIFSQTMAQIRDPKLSLAHNTYTIIHITIKILNHLAQVLIIKYTHITYNFENPRKIDWKLTSMLIRFVFSLFDHLNNVFLKNTKHESCRGRKELSEKSRTNEFRVTMNFLQFLQDCWFLWEKDLRILIIKTNKENMMYL